MTLPLLPLLAGALLGKSTKNDQKLEAVSKYTKKNGTKVAAHTRKKK